MTMRSSLAFSAALLFAAAGCSSAGKFPVEIPDPNTPEAIAAAASLTGTAWEPVRIHEQTGASIVSIEVHDGTAYVLDSANTVHAIDMANGTHRWVLFLDRAPTRPMLVGSDRVGFLSRAHLTVCAKTTGTRLLDRDLDFTPSAGGALTLDTLYTASWGDSYRLRTVSLYDGWPGWFHAVGGPVTASPLVVGSGADQMVYVAAQDGSVAALEARPATAEVPGTVAWSYRTLGKNAANLAHDDQTLFIASEDRALYALNRLVGSVSWKWFSDQPLAQAPAVAATRVYQPIPGAVVAIDKATGDTAYTFTGGVRYLTTVSGHDMFECEDGQIAVLNAGNGVEIGRVRSPLLDIVASNASGEGLIFSCGKTLYLLK